MTEPELDVDYFRQKLLEMRRELIEASDETRLSRAPVQLDQTSVGRLSRMDALERQSMAQATERRRTALLARIDAALTRIEDGEYGICAVSGERIPIKRLELDPTALTCVQHAK